MKIIKWRVQEDVQLMKNMGMDAYRFSISWTRIFPSTFLPFHVYLFVQFYIELQTLDGLLMI